jgi:phenylacetyl-CoA:acceptor oxidoreductase subunit 2
LAAPLLFLAGLLALWTGNIMWIWVAALFGITFLYCQARILNASKGIPAWREPRLAPLIIMTGLTEGAGLLAIISALSGETLLARSVAAALLFGILARAVLWRGYRNALSRQAAPPQTLAAFHAIDFPFVILGHWTAALALGFAFAAPEMGGVTWLCAAGGFLVVASGWLFKYTLVARAAYNQGYALHRVPVRGTAPASASKP